MQSRDIVVFKNEIKNYYDYKERIVKLDELIDYCYHMLGADPKTVDPSKQIVHSPPNKDYEYKVRDEIELHEGKKRRTQDKIDEIDIILNKIEKPLRDAILRVYGRGEKLLKVGNDMYTEPSTLYKQINKAIKKALNE